MSWTAPWWSSQFTGNHPLLRAVPLQSPSFVSTQIRDEDLTSLGMYKNLVWM